MVKDLKRIYITGGREVGGVSAFAAGLRSGIIQNGIDAKIVTSPLSMLKHINKWRASDTAWVLSTWGLFFAPFLKRSIGVAHGAPLPYNDGLLKSNLVAFALRFCSVFAPISTVSGYISIQLKNIWGVNTTAIIHNLLRDEFFTPTESAIRSNITYIGRMIDIKQVNLLLDAFETLKLDQAGYNLVIVGRGPMESTIKSRTTDIKGAKYIENLNAGDVCSLLRSTKVFYSGCVIEAFGISLLEAHACGANIVCPSMGGFVETVIPELQNSVFLFPPSGGCTEVAAALENALQMPNNERACNEYHAREIASKYIELMEQSSRQESNPIASQ